MQVAGPLAPLRTQLEAKGWRLQAQAGWEQALNLLDNDLPEQQQPVLPATLDTRAESLLMLREGARPGEMLALRLWVAPTHLQPGDMPLWIGSVQTLQHQRALEFIGMWRPLREAGSSLQALSADIGPLQHQLEPHPETQWPVLRIRTDRTGPNIGENYETARARLLESGWVAVPAQCSERNLCWDHPELATRLSDSETCASFTKGKSEIRVCTESVPDHTTVKSFNLR